MGKHIAAALVVVACLVASCGGGSSGPGPIDELADGYYEETLALNPLGATVDGDHRYDAEFANDISPAYRAALRELVDRTSAELARYDREELDDRDPETYDVLDQVLRAANALLDFPNHLLPLNHIYAHHLLFAQLGGGASFQPFETVADYDAFRSRMDGFAVWADQAIANMREGMSSGIVLPRVVAMRVLGQLDAYVALDAQSSVFWAPIASMPATFPPAEQSRLTAAYEDGIENVVLPAYTRLRDFVRDEYVAGARDTIGLCALPNGQAWYRAMLLYHTTQSATAQDLYDLGIAEAGRIGAEMTMLATMNGFVDAEAMLAAANGDAAQTYASAAEVLAHYEAIETEARAALSSSFAGLPATPFEIRPVDAAIAASSPPAYYYPGEPDGSPPGIFFLNTTLFASLRRYSAAALFLHEGMPGHHFQFSTQRELADLPRLRRTTNFTAYAEGWALYCESLGSERGLYDDPYRRLGALTADLGRALRLVVDTGIHSLCWTRDEALGVIASPIEIDRYAALPGQATAYKVGESAIRALRADAETRLGSRFDRVAFHAAILGAGSLPLDALEDRIDRWVRTHP